MAGPWAAANDTPSVMAAVRQPIVSFPLALFIKSGMAANYLMLAINSSFCATEFKRSILF